MLRSFMQRFLPAAALFLGIELYATELAAASRSQVKIETSNVYLFYRLYDAAGGSPSGEVLQRDYIDAGTAGVRQFVPDRILSGAAMAKTISQDRLVYEKARECVAVIPAVKRRLTGVFKQYEKLDPETTFPPVTILIGRNNSGGTTGSSGVLIGLEVVCSATHLQPNVEDRLVHLIAHEYAHVQQLRLSAQAAEPTTVLRQSLIEGVAEFLAELTSGEASESYLQRWTAGHEQEIGARFVHDLDSQDLKPWLYNGVGSAAAPGDLGYWVGYCIAKSYYRMSAEQRDAVRTLLELRDPKHILQASGWQPGRPCSPGAPGMSTHQGRRPSEPPARL